MLHPTDDELIEQFCGDAEPSSRARIEAHLRDCGECQRVWADLAGALTIVNDAVPEPPDGFERVMWARVSQALARAPQTAWTWSWRQVLPAGALLAAVVAGIAVGQFGEVAQTPEPAATSADLARDDIKQNERVLFTALDEHFQQTEALLVELRNAPDRDNLRIERLAADDLVAAGRLYRQSAEFTGHQGLVRMLDDLEPVLVEMARSPERIDRRDRQWLRTRIDEDNLLFKVRAVTNDIRELRGND